VEWDAASYDAHALPQQEWGQVVLERLRLSGDETVLDAGCGTGKTTRTILERIPRGRLIGVDASAAMIDEARATLGDDPRVELRVADLTELDIEDEVDVVFSSATFHWILEHELLFERLFAALRPGGRMETQCGGDGNIAEIHRALDALSGDERFAPYLRSEQRTWNFAGVGNTETRLQRAGFEVENVWLEPWPITPRDPGGFLRTVILPWHFERLPEGLHEEFVEAVLESQPRPLSVSYVRLNISARKPG
jgi:trans-aconitate 2-methyltransferase